MNTLIMSLYCIAFFAIHQTCATTKYHYRRYKLIIVMAWSFYQVLNNHDTFIIDNRPNDPPRAFSLEFTLELSSNFRLSDTKFQTRLVEQRYCENDILAVFASIESCQARRVHWLPRQPCVTDWWHAGCWDCR